MVPVCNAIGLALETYVTGGGTMAGSRQNYYYSAKHKTKGRKFSPRNTNMKQKIVTKQTATRIKKLKPQHFISLHTRGRPLFLGGKGKGLASSSGVEDKSKGFITLDYTKLHTTKIGGLS